MATIVKSISNPPLTLWATFVPCFHLSPGHTDLYRVFAGSCPAWYRTLRPRTVYRSSLSFSPCPHRVHTASSEICNAALKYVLLLWNMYCRSEICIVAPKYILPLRNMLSRRQALPAPRPLTVLIPGSQRVPPLVPTRRKVLSMPKLSPAANGSPNVFTDRSTPRRVPSPCSTVLTEFTTRWHTVGLAGTMWQLHSIQAHTGHFDCN